MRHADSDRPEPQTVFSRESELLPTEMPSVISRGFGWVVILSFICAVLASLVVRIPETVTCEFLLVLEKQVAPIKSPLAGEVDQVLVKQGQLVNVGDPLFHIRSQEIRSWRSELEQEQATLQRHGERFKAIPLEQRAERLTDEAALSKIQQQLASMKIELAQLKRQHKFAASAHREELTILQEKIKLFATKTANRRQYLATITAYVKKSEGLDRSIISSSELMKRRLEQTNAALEVVRAQQEATLEKLRIRQVNADRLKARGAEQIALGKLRAEIVQIEGSKKKQELDTDNRKLKWTDQRQELEFRIAKTQLKIAALNQQLEDTQGDQIRIVRAPYKGTILSIARKTAGDVVARGAVLCQIHPSDTRIIAELTVPENGLPRLRRGQRVKFLFEAFPYQRYGVRQGKLDQILPSPVIRDDKQRVRLAYASLTDTFITVDGRRRPLRVGMKGESRILIGRRALIEYIFEPLRQLRESVSEMRLKSQQEH